MRIEQLFSVEGLVVVVTGGSSGIGLGIAEGLAENGARVTIVGRNAERAEAEAARLRARGLDVAAVAADMTDAAAVDALIEGVCDRYGRLDVVFANAGAMDDGPTFVGFDRTTRIEEGSIDRYSDERWQTAIATNLTSVFLTIRAAAAPMKRQRGGRIIVTTSLAAFFNDGLGGLGYMASKAGAAHLVRQAALELAGYDILVNSIAPGPFRTNAGGGILHDPAVEAMIARSVLLGRMAPIEEIQGLAIFLASRASSYVTGTQIVIDGGMHFAGAGGVPDRV